MNGSNCTLSVTADAPGQTRFPLHYQWQFNGTNIAQATATTYTFAVSAAGQGSYSVVVTNAAGSTE